MPVLCILLMLLSLLILGTVLFSGVAMVVSPRQWFDLPTYLTLRNGTFNRKELATRSGRFAIRYFGVAFAAFPAYMGASFFGFLSGSPSSLMGRVSSPAWWMALSVFLAPGICGAVMLLKPKWQIYRYRRYRAPHELS